MHNILSYKKDHRDITERYDRHVGFHTVLNSDHGGAAVVALRSELTKNEFCGVGFTAGCLYRQCEVDPFWGAYMTVLSQARELSAAGVFPLAITDCLNFGNPENPKVMYDFSRSIDGLIAICSYLNTPVVSGNVSLYNETDGVSIYPTPMIGMVGKISDYRQARPAILKQENQTVYALIPTSEPKYGGSTALHVMGLKPTSDELTPIVVENEMHALRWIRRAELNHCRIVSSSGLLGTLMKMVLPNQLGFEFLDNFSFDPSVFFGDMQGGFLMSADTKPECDLTGYELREIGKTSLSKEIKINGLKLDYQKLQDSFRGDLI